MVNTARRKSTVLAENNYSVSWFDTKQLIIPHKNPIAKRYIPARKLFQTDAPLITVSVETD